jgi:hypothetical protein
MRKQIHHRDDVSPKEGSHKYGAVKFADPVNNKYPIDTPEHIHAAWSYIHHKDTAAKYTAKEVTEIKDRIKHAANEHSIEISEESQSND